MNTRIDALKSRMVLPAIAAPMFLVSNPETVIAACKAGVMGSFPGPNARTSADLREWLTEISSNVGPNDAPWAMNMITHTSYGRFDDEIALVEEFQPDLVITALGGPHRVTQQVHGYGGLVFADVTSPKFARKALEKGADGLVLVCAGAGGHTGEFAMLPFIEEVRSFFDGPLIVGGGIGTGRAIRAVENLGADFAYVADSVLLPETRRLQLSDSRTRVRGGVRYFGENYDVFYGLTWLGKEFDSQPEGQTVGSLRLNLHF